MTTDPLKGRLLTSQRKIQEEGEMGGGLEVNNRNDEIR